MATDPRFPIAANHPIPARLTTGNTAKDGTGTVVTLFTAGVDGAILNNIYIQPSETNTVASVLRFFLNNGDPSSTASNNILLCEELTPIVSAASETVARELYTVSGIVDRLIPAGYKVLVSISVSPTNPLAVYATGENY